MRRERTLSLLSGARAARGLADWSGIPFRLGSPRARGSRRLDIVNGLKIAFGGGARPGLDPAGVPRDTSRPARAEPRRAAPCPSILGYFPPESAAGHASRLGIGIRTLCGAVGLSPAFACPGVRLVLNLESSLRRSSLCAIAAGEGGRRDAQASVPKPPEE